MKTPEERLWDDVTDAATPSAAELAAAEAELRELEGAAPMAPELVAAVVARATAADAGRFRPVSGQRRLWLMAALLFVSISAAAAVVLQLVPTQQLAPVTLDYSEAVRLATQPNADDQTRLKAVHVIDEHCGSVAAALRSLEAGTDADLANTARHVRSALASLLAGGPQAVPGSVDPGFRATIAAIVDRSRSIEERVRLLQEVQRQADSGLTALLQLGSFLTGEAKVRYDSMLKRLVRDFGG